MHVLSSMREDKNTHGMCISILNQEDTYTINISGYDSQTNKWETKALSLSPTYLHMPGILQKTHSPYLLFADDNVMYLVNPEKATLSKTLLNQILDEGNAVLY